VATPSPSPSPGSALAPGVAVPGPAPAGTPAVPGLIPQPEESPAPGQIYPMVARPTTTKLAGFAVVGGVGVMGMLAFCLVVLSDGRRNRVRPQKAFR